TGAMPWTAPRWLPWAGGRRSILMPACSAPSTGTRLRRRGGEPSSRASGTPTTGASTRPGWPTRRAHEPGDKSMIRRHLTLLRAVLMSADALTASALFLILVEIRFQGADPDIEWLKGIRHTPWLAAGYGVLWVASMWVVGLYRLRTRLTLRSE